MADSISWQVVSTKLDLWGETLRQVKEQNDELLQRTARMEEKMEQSEDRADDFEGRLRELEKYKNEQRGKNAITSMAAGGIVALLVALIQYALLGG